MVLEDSEKIISVMSHLLRAKMVTCYMHASFWKFIRNSESVAFIQMILNLLNTGNLEFKVPGRINCLKTIPLVIVLDKSLTGFCSSENITFNNFVN